MNGYGATTLWTGGPVRHGDPEPWVACEEPERPADRGVGYHAGCAACLIACQAHVATGYLAPAALSALTDLSERRVPDGDGTLTVRLMERRVQ